MKLHEVSSVRLFPSKPPTKIRDWIRASRASGKECPELHSKRLKGEERARSKMIWERKDTEYVGINMVF